MRFCIKPYLCKKKYMEESTSREKLIKRVRVALMNKSKEANREPVAVDYETPIFHMAGEPDEIAFAQNFTEAGGRFVFCLDEDEFIENLRYVMREQGFDHVFCAEAGLQQLLGNKDISFEPQAVSGKPLPMAALASCEQAIASTGSLVVSSHMQGARLVSAHFSHLLLLCHTAQVSPNHREALRKLKWMHAGVLPPWVNILSPSQQSGSPQLFVFMLDVNEPVQNAE
jgi:L-lactate dehydrogenase complex protein LldG